MERALFGMNINWKCCGLFQMKHLFQAAACNQGEWGPVGLFAVSVLHFQGKKINTGMDLSVKRIIFVKITGTTKFFNFIGDGILGKASVRHLKEGHKIKK